MEFKESLRGEARDPWHRIAASVSSLANAEGGVIVFGIVERDAVAIRAAPIEFKDDIESMEKALSAKIHPRVGGMSWHVVPSSSDAGYLCLEVRRSPLRPHLLSEKGGFSAWRRVRTERHELTEADMERCYRERWEARGQIDSMHKRFSEEVDRDGRASVYMAAVPEVPTGRTLAIDRKYIDRFNEISNSDRCVSMFGGRIFPPHGRVRFRRFELGDSWATSATKGSRGHEPWHVVNDSGSYLVSRPAFSTSLISKPSDWPSGAAYFADSSSIVDSVCSAFVAFRELCSTFKLGGQYSLRFGIKCKGPLPMRMPFGSSLLEKFVLEESVEVETSLDTNDLVDSQRWMIVAYEVVVDLHGGFGLNGPSLITKQGLLQPKTSEQSGNVRHWAKINGVGMVE